GDCSAFCAAATASVFKCCLIFSGAAPMRNPPPMPRSPPVRYARLTLFSNAVAGMARASGSSVGVTLGLCEAHPARAKRMHPEMRNASDVSDCLADPLVEHFAEESSGLALR